MGIADLGVKRCKGRGGKTDCQAAFPDLCSSCKAGVGTPDLMLALERSLQTEVREGVTEPCGDCDGCRLIDAERRAGGMTPTQKGTPDDHD